MALPRSGSKSGEEYDFLFRRPSAIRASQFEQAILAIGSASDELDFKIAVCQGIHSVLQNVLKTETLFFLHDDLRYLTSKGESRKLTTTGVLWKVIRQRSFEVFRNIPSDDPIYSILEITPESIDNRIVLVEAVTNINKMRTVSLIIAVCDEPTPDQRLKYDWLIKNVEVAAGRIIDQEKRDREKLRMEGMLKLSGSLIDLDVQQLLLKLHSHIKQIIGCNACAVLILEEEDSELVCEVFDNSPLDEEIRLSVAECIYGKCILSGETVLIEDVSKDPLINPTTDFIYDYEPSNLLVLPIKCRRTSVGNISTVGACVVYDKSDGFTTQDKDNLEYILKFCSSMLVNTLTYRHELVLKHQNQTLLTVSRNLFSRLYDRNVLLHSIMEEARDLTKAERCSLFLVDDDKQSLFAVVFDSELPDKDDHGSSNVLRIPLGQGIAGFVAQSGKTVNIRDAYKNPHFYKEIDKTTGFITRNILCIPIIDQFGVVGVAQLVNKVGGKFFTNYDEELAKSFAVYCGISLHQSMLYKNVLMEQSRSQVATELMLYHMKVGEDDIQQLSNDSIELCHNFNPHMSELTFSPRCITEKDTMCVISMMNEMELLQRWKIPRNNLARFILMVKKGYRNPPYHNWMHAFSVSHFSYSLFMNCSKLNLLSELEVLALFVSCLCHDIDHRGTNNAFQEISKSVLASLYSSQGSVMERHHFSQTMCILNHKGCRIFENLTSEEYRKILDLIHDIILATDLSTHLSIMKDLQEMASSGYDRSNSHHHHLLCSLLMTSCDLCACLKDWDSTVATSKLIYQEFFSQGDREKAIGKTPSVMMDRDKAILSEQQLGFLDNIAIPVYKVLSEIMPETKPAYENVLKNKENWKEWQENAS